MKTLKYELLLSIIEDIVNNNSITERVLANKYEVSERTIRRYIKILKDANIIEIKDSKKRKWLIIKWYSIYN